MDDDELLSYAKALEASTNLVNSLVKERDALLAKLETAKEALKNIRNKRYSWTLEEIRMNDIVHYVDEALKQLEAE